ncbi:MAG: glycosyltransferase [Verrucomicrobiales bacterium]|nr:glycosyltransferase [Verrucomicrobiales bacterium]
MLIIVQTVDSNLMINARACFSRLKRGVMDSARHARLTRELAGWAHLIQSAFVHDDAERAYRLSRAYTFAEFPALQQLVLRRLRRLDYLPTSYGPGSIHAATVWRRASIMSKRNVERLAQDSHISRSIVLKRPGAEGERGVLLITFEYNWLRLMMGLDDSAWTHFDQHYDLILSASWSPTDYAALAMIVCSTPRKVYVQTCNYDEIARIEAFHPRLRCLPTLPCDWINPANFTPLSSDQRDIDFLMVSNWGEFKRHWELFRALARMPSNLKIVLIGQPEPGRSQEYIAKLASEYGVPQKLQFVESVPIQTVASFQCRAKVSVIMSLREGCCVAAVESLFAGCALAMREDAHVGPLAYVNAKTGRRLRPRFVAQDLMALHAQASEMDPSGWARKNISMTESWKRVNAFLKRETQEDQRPWTEDICMPEWHPHPTFANAEESDIMKPAYERLQALAPSVFPSDLRHTSWR